MIPASLEQRERVGEAARRLVELRDGWLNPTGLDPADVANDEIIDRLLALNLGGAIRDGRALPPQGRTIGGGH